MNNGIALLKWSNYISLLFALSTFLYSIVIDFSPFGMLIPAYFTIFSFLDLFVLSFVNKAAGNPTQNIFKDWGLFFWLLGIYFVATLIISIIK